MTRDSREFSAALVLGAVGGAALAIALKSASSRGQGKSRAWSDLVSSLDWGEVVSGLRESAEPFLASKGRSSVSGASGAASSGLDALRTASRRLRELGIQVAPGRR